MDLIAALTLAFLTGLTVAGLAGSTMELVFRQRLRLSAPFVQRERILLSLAATAVAGPFMLANEALASFRARRIGAAALAISMAVSFVWVLATGIVVAEVALGAIG